MIPFGCYRKPHSGLMCFNLHITLPQWSHGILISRFTLLVPSAYGRGCTSLCPTFPREESGRVLPSTGPPPPPVRPRAGAGGGRLAPTPGARSTGPTPRAAGSRREPRREGPRLCGPRPLPLCAGARAGRVVSSSLAPPGHPAPAAGVPASGPRVPRVIPGSMSRGRRKGGREGARARRARVGRQRGRESRQSGRRSRLGCETRAARGRRPRPCPCPCPCLPLRLPPPPAPSPPAPWTPSYSGWRIMNWRDL